MPRRNPAAVAPAADQPRHRLSADDLGELLTQAKVQKASREACARDFNQALDFYNRRLAHVNAPSEASRAESLRLVSEAASQLAKTLAALPPALRLAVEPDYRALIRGAAGQQEQGDEKDAAGREAADVALLRSITPSQLDAMPTATKPPRRRRMPDAGAGELADLLARAREPLSLELTLAALIATAEQRRLAIERQVSPGASRLRGTFWRNQLARELKAIGAAYSPAFAANERQAEDWAASVLDMAEIRYPARATNPTAFRSTFGKRGKPPI